MASCSAEMQLPSEESSIEVVNLQITPALVHWLPQVADCAEDIANFGIYTQVLPLSELNLDQADLILQLGKPIDSESHIAVMGVEEIGIIVGDQVPVSSLSIESVQAIYSGSILHWGKIPEVIDAGIEIDQPIQLLSYPEGTTLNILFKESYFDKEISPDNLLFFSTIEYLESLLQEHPYSIGYLLKSQFPAETRELTITGFDPQNAQHYVLAITPQEPLGNLRQLLLCLQNSQ